MDQETIGQAPRVPLLSPAAGLSVLLAAVVFYVCLFNGLSALGFVGPDEPRYASVARAMLESGDWVTPRLNGTPWFEKPVLYYWTAAAGFRIFGASEFAARLPSALAAALGTFALAWFGRRTWGRRAAWTVLLILPTLVGMFSFARAATPDMLFSVTLAMAMMAAHAAVQTSEQEPAHGRGGRFLALILFGMFLGAATLAKGPAAIVLATGSIGLWTLLSRRWRAALGLAHPVSILSFAATALPWYVLCARRNPAFIQEFVVAHNVERYLTPMFRHEQPFWFFGPILVLALLPWTATLVGVAEDAVQVWRRRRWAESSGSFVACWAIFPVLFFSFSRSKLPGYILPAVLPLGLLLARAVSRRFEENPLAGSRLMAGTGIVWLAIGFSAGLWLRRLPAESGFASGSLALGWIVPAIAGGACITGLGIACRPKLAFLLCVVLLTGMVGAAAEKALPRLDASLSPRVAAKALEGMREDVYLYRINRSWEFGLDYYLQRELPRWTPQEPLPVWVLTDAAGISELRQMGFQTPDLRGDHKQPMILIRLRP